MKNLRTMVLAAVIGVSMSVAIAQPGGGKGPGTGPGLLVPTLN